MSCISAKCSSGVFFNCPSRCFNEPLVSRLITFPPASMIQFNETPLSTNPRTSILSKWLFFPAHSVILFTALYSPLDTLAEATSILFTFSSSKSNLATASFSDSLKETPVVCSPSRKVVSITSMVVIFIVLLFLSEDFKNMAV